MITTLNKIRAHHPCANGWKKLLLHLGKTQADDEPISIATILDSNGLEDAIWCLQAPGITLAEAKKRFHEMVENDYE